MQGWHKSIHNALWLQIISRRRLKFSQPAPRGFACSQNIAAVGTQYKKSHCWDFLYCVRLLYQVRTYFQNK